jgi:lantibiotic biosynthesis protein
VRTDNTAGIAELAAVVFDDARKLIAEPGQETFANQLDLCLTALEFKRATGCDLGVRDHFMNGLDLMRSSHGIGPWIYDGAAHVGWLAFKLADLEELRVVGLSMVDDIVGSWIEDYPEDRDVDLPQGVLGLGVYGLGHPAQDVRDRITAGVLDVIEGRLESHQGESFIRLSNADWRRALRPGMVGLRDMGVAHGNAGLAAYLARVAQAAPEFRPRALALLVPLVTWLLRQRIDMDGAIFPQAVETRYEGSRSAWCYGDPGISLALWIVARALPPGDLRESVARTAREAAHAALARPASETGVVDASLCHGAAGLCYFGRRAGELFGDFGGSGYMRSWHDYVDEQRRNGPLNYYRSDAWRRDGSFLEGDCGVALALLYAATGRQPVWDERLLTARPDRT